MNGTGVTTSDELLLKALDLVEDVARSLRERAAESRAFQAQLNDVIAQIQRELEAKEDQ